MRFPGRRSGLVAKDRLKLVLSSERLDCTPQMMTMLKNDMIRAVDKYFSVQDPLRECLSGDNINCDWIKLTIRKRCFHD